MAGKCFHHDYPPSRTTQLPQNIIAYQQQGWVHRTSAKKGEFPELLSVTFLLKQSRTNNRSRWSWKPARNSVKGNEARGCPSTTCLTISQPPPPSQPNTNPWLRFSALCLHPSPLHTLLPLKRAVFPSPYRLSLQLLAVCFSTWELSPRVPCPLLIHLRHTPPHTCALCCLVQLPCPQSRAQQSRVRIQQPKLRWYAQQQIVSNQMYRHVPRLLRKGTYKTVPRRRACLLLLTLPSTSRLFWSLCNARTAAQKPLAWLGISRKDQSLGIAVSALKLSWSVTEFIEFWSVTVLCVYNTC